MKTARCFAVLLLVISASVRADGFFGFEPSGCGSLVTNNMTPKWTWITVYDVTQSFHLDYGWMAPFGSRTWKSGRYSCAGIYHVRAEVKSTEGPSPPASDPGNMFDTRIEVKGSDHSIYLKTPIKVQLTDAPPNRWQYASTTFYLELNGNTAAAAATGTLPRVILHNPSNLPIMLRVLGNPLQYSGCIGPNGASNAMPVDGVSVNVQDCNNQFRFTPAMGVGQPFGTSDAYFKSAFESGALKQSFTTGLKFVNGLGSPVEYAVTTAPGAGPVKSLGGKCIVPGLSDTLALAPGTVQVSAYAVQTCGSPQRIPYLTPQSFNIIAGTTLEVGVRAWLDGRP